jgi:diazepam-binding inhibitor (GABA receptor modulating acyl-CoA-binding protein)
MQVATEVRATAYNFAEEGVTSVALPKQVEEFKKNDECSPSDVVAMIHCGGNNLLENLVETMSEPVDGFASQVCQDIKTGIAALYDAGVKYFVTSDVPFSAVVPEIKVMLEHYARANDCTFERTNADAIEREQKLNQTIASMAQSLPQEFPGMKIIHFPEINELRKWNGEEELFDSDRLHPSDEGHAKLQKTLLAQIEEAGFLKGSSDASASLAQPRAAAMTPEKVKLPSKRTSADVVSEQSIKQQFDNIISSGESLLGDLRQSEKLEFYGLYKQAQLGDNQTAEPNFFLNYVAHKKWQAWMDQEGKSKNQAMTEYVDMYRAIGAKKSRSS